MMFLIKTEEASMRIIKNIFLTILLLLGSTALQAESGSHVKERLSLFKYGDTSFLVGDGDDALDIHRVMRPCGKNKGFIQPLIPAEGVTLVSEIDVMHALNDEDARIVDMRLENEYLDETIPKAINVPYLDVEPHMEELGCQKKADTWECSDVKKIYAFCNGAVCTKSPIGIRALIALGFPAQKIFYYRGGMLVWSAVGLNVVEGDF